MKVETFLGVLLAIICICQSSTLVVDIVEISTYDNHTFVCNVSSSTNSTRWTYLAGPNGTSLMSFQNGTCTVSPSDSFLSDSRRYSYACNSTLYQVTVKYYQDESRTNNILDCKDAHQLKRTGSTWIIKIKAASVNCIYCQPTILFDMIEITEGDNVTFVCSVPSNVSYVNWNRNIGANTAPVSLQNGTCITSGNGTFLDHGNKYNFTCNQTVYQVTVLNVTRSEHNDIYMCTPAYLAEGNGSNWIFKVKAQVTFVTITTPPDYNVYVNESTLVELTCTTSTARPAASVYWYKHPNGKDHIETQITDNISTTTDFNDLSVTTSILRLFVTCQDHNTKVFCRANNAANTTKLISKYKRLLNVLCAPRAAGEINTNITSAKNASKTITVNVIAYPPPTFTWSKLIKGKWTSLNKNKFDINSSDVQSNLTILRVGMDDFTKYQVIVKNKVGLMEQNFTLSPYGFPDTPTELKHIQSQTATSSIHIEWRPGYNGGPTQTFYIKYKKSSDSTWTYFTVIDSGKQIMDISLTGLVENTEYDIVILASNIIGNSSESQVLVASTEATSTGALIGGIAGGVTVCIIIVIVIIVIVRRYKFSDGLVDNPMYESSSPVARPASPFSDVKSDIVKPDINGSSDLYAQVQKTKKKDVIVNKYEIVDVNTDNNMKSDMKKPPQVKATTNDSKMSNFNQDGLKYADLVFNGSQPVLKKEMKVYEPTPYDLVDFTKKAEPHPDSDDDDNK